MYRDKTKYGMNNTEIFILIHQIFIFTLNKMHYSNIWLAVLQKYIAKKKSRHFIDPLIPLDSTRALIYRTITSIDWQSPLT